MYHNILEKKVIYKFQREKIINIIKFQKVEKVIKSIMVCINVQSDKYRGNIHFILFL